MSVFPLPTDADLVDFQTLADLAMTLTLTAYEPGAKVVDVVTGYESLGYSDRGTTPGKVQGGSQAGKDTQTRYLNVGGVDRPVLEGGLHLPVDAFLDDDGRLLIKPGRERGLGWEFEVTDVCGPADPSLLGRRYLVVEVPAKSFFTARRLSVVEVV